MKFLRNNHKGFFFSYDALVALSILFISFIVVMNAKPPTALKYSEYEQMQSISEDAMQIFATTPFSSVSEPLKGEIINAANLTEKEMDKSLLDIVGILWGISETEYAANMTRDFFGKLFGSTANYSLVIDGKTIYNSSSVSERRVLSSSSRVLSGYKQNNPNTGFVAKAYIAGVRKSTQSYAYFGGFEGSGNIVKLVDLPASVDVISEIYMEMDTPSNFTLYINGASAGSYSVSNRAPLRTQNWTVPPGYYSNLVPGQNNITLAFPNINTAYVGGGFIRVKYNTTIMDTTEIQMNPDGNATEKYYFPGIDGLINLYSSFYVPGTLRSMGIRLHYSSEGTVYLNIGNTTVYENSTNLTQTVYLNNTLLASKLAYSRFNRTMPIRFGTKNITGLAEGSDAVLVTDLSGSMSICDVNASISPPDCNNPGIKHTRLYSAKDSDREFVNVILGNPGQKVGLIAFESTTVNSKTVYLTDNITKLNNTINSYTTYSNTCTSCGINDATNMLASTLNRTSLVANKSSWYYNNSFYSSEPPLDSQGRNWIHINYSLGSQWTYRYAVFGNDSTTISASYLPKTATNISANGLGIRAYGNLWDMAADKATPEVDFTSGINSTANTFGLGGGDDGWDWGAKYDYDNNTIIYGKNIGGKIVFSTLNGTNKCANYDCSGGYGIQINITPAQYAIISSGGDAYLSFEYSWKQTGSTDFDIYDELWIKGRWTSNVSGAVHYLGTEQQDMYGDTTPEIDDRDNPYFSFTDNFVQNITGWIEGPGTYYLDFGGKVRTSKKGGDGNKGGNFSFDNILLEFSNNTDATYFRKNFTVQNMASLGKGILKIMSDDAVDVYLNNALIYADKSPAHNAKYWNSVSFINRNYFNQGNNVLAIKLYNKLGSSRFDLELVALNDSRNKAMLVMSDGEANTLIGNIFDSDLAPLDAINRSCSAYEKYGIIVHAVAFGSGIGSSTLKSIAECGHGIYATSNDEDELKAIYRDIANAIVTYTTQAAEITGGSSIGKLYSDSFIEYNYTPAVDIKYGDISLTRESDAFGNTSGNYSIESPKNGSYNISSTMLVIDAKATSYSSDFWTNTLEVNSTSGSWKTVFNLSDFGNNYLSLGDPYIVNIPVNLVRSGETNYVRINTAKNSTALTGGSPDDRVIYSIKVKGSVDYGATNETLEGAIADAKRRLLESLPPGISASDINTGTIDIGKIPWMWGPAIVTLNVWRE